MGNTAGKLNPCFCPTGDISARHDIAVVLASNTLDEGIGHSFCYIRPPESFALDDVVSPLYSTAQTTPFLPTISGASVSANTSTPLSTALFDPFFPVNSDLDRAASFHSSPSFASVPLQPIPRSLISSGPLLRNPGSGSILGSGPIERGFLSGPIERGFLSGPMDKSLFSGSLENSGGSKKTGDNNSMKSKHKLMKWRSIRGIKDAILGAIWGPTVTMSKKMMMNLSESVGKSTITTSSSSSSCSCANLSSQGSLCDEHENGDDIFSMEAQNLQWAHGKAGEDRVDVVVSEEHGWVFVGIYDGFNGPDATDFLLSNLYPAVHKELKGVLWDDQGEELDRLGRTSEGSATSTSPRCFEKRRNSDVLAALSEALRKTEEAYLDIADKMILENPVLSLMGSCVLVMLMKGDDVFLMNVGDSRAVLGQRGEENSFENDPFDDLPNVNALQITIDHNTLDKEESRRIKNEHPHDHDVITANERVKGSLKVTRAFGAGFLKNPKWNKGLLEMFRIDYIGSSPYITCSPSLHHHKISSKDKFLILSSDGLYQYFTNEEAVTEVELFMASTPEGDPAQHLIEEVLFRAAKKVGMEFHELLDIPQGERRRYHDDVSIIIVSFEGRTWHSSL